MLAMFNTKLTLKSEAEHFFLSFTVPFQVFFIVLILWLTQLLAHPQVVRVRHRLFITAFTISLTGIKMRHLSNTDIPCSSRSVYVRYPYSSWIFSWVFSFSSPFLLLSQVQYSHLFPHLRWVCGEADGGWTWAHQTRCQTTLKQGHHLQQRYRLSWFLPFCSPQW